MSACPDQTVLLQGLLDDELDAANALAAEQHLRTCEGCNAEFLRLLALRDVLRRPGVAYAAPDALRARIEASLVPAEPTRARRRPLALAPWLSAGALSAIAAVLALVIITPRLAAEDVERQLVAGHVRSLLANHLTDVATSSQHVVRPWFNGKVDFAPPAPELADEGFPLVGGRLDYIGGRVTPAIVYRRRLHSVNLFVWPDSARTPEHTARRDGYSLVEWSQGGLRFSAVSDIDLAELKQFKEAVSERSPR